MVDCVARSLSVVTEIIIHKSIQILRGGKFVDAGIGGRVGRSVVLLLDGESTHKHMVDCPNCETENYLAQNL